MKNGGDDEYRVSVFVGLNSTVASLSMLDSLPTISSCIKTICVWLSIFTSLSIELHLDDVFCFRGAYCFTKIGSLTESELYTASGLTFNISSNSTVGACLFRLFVKFEF